MKHSIDTYRLYADESVITFSVRIKVTMKDEVDINILRHAVNVAIKRYPYFAVKVVLGEDGGYDFEPNNLDVVVMPTPKKLPPLGSEEVNLHLLYVDCDGKNINFNISHSMCGGRGILPWVMTNVYQYVVEKYGVTPNVPGIRKPDSPLLPGEADEPSLETIPDEEPIYEYKSKNPVVMLIDYLNGLYNPLKRNPNYYFFTFNQKDIMNFAKDNDSSVAAFFLVALAKALHTLLPEKYEVIGGEIAHNPSADIGMPNTHCDLLSHIHIDYKRDYFNYDIDKLGTLTRSQIILQADPSVSAYELKKRLMLIEEVDKIDGLKNKRSFYQKNDPSRGKDAKHGTFIVNYTGKMDWGDVADYVESYGALVDGHLLLEVTSMADKIFVTFMQLIKESKYVNAFCKVMDDLGIEYKIEGPYKNNRPKHQVPQK
ncbi:hypothetical protein [Pseudobutyrivibrio sp. MD2005]|uniref:hypothetical protein n=1 Tax=Pseudobutyrivibrio sp. MD2005 TaxID=1410616 RepID=UPI00048556CD|nr:hypothetical protein [Pseudobutyrivibrio sp. MD2005]